MGKMAILLVIGMSMIVGMVAVRFNNTRNGIVPGLVENVSGFQKYTMARNIAHTGVNMMLRRLDRNDTAIVNPLGNNQTAWLITPLMGGVCSVSVKLASLASPPKRDTIDMTSRAKYYDTSKSMIIRLVRRPVPFPVIGEALVLRTTDVDFSIHGQAGAIDGRDHDINGNLVSPPDSNYKPAVGVQTVSDSIHVAGYKSQLIGSPTDVKIDTNMLDPAAYVQDYINGADYTFTDGTYGSNMVWGSEISPVIVYVSGTNGGVKFTGTVKGWGILVVKGSLWVSGTFQFHGLVLCYNDVTIERDTLINTGTPDFIGAVVLAGASGSQFTMKGNGQLSYSYAALEMARFINKLQVYRVIRWYE